jgi:hypothetical protein
MEPDSRVPHGNDMEEDLVVEEERTIVVVWVSKRELYFLGRYCSTPQNREKPRDASAAEVFSVPYYPKIVHWALIILVHYQRH